MGSPACADLEVREPSEGRLLAATRNASKPTNTLGIDQQHRTTPHQLREDPRTPRGPQPPRPADGQFRLAARQREVEGPGRGTSRRRARRAFRQVRSGGDLRGDLADRGLPADDVAVVLRAGVLRAQVLGRRVQGTRHDLLGPAVRDGRVHEQHDRRDQEPDGVHGRLPADDQQGHLRHQRHRACRGVPAGPVAGRLLRQVAGQDVRQGHLRLQDHPVARCLARVRDRQARPGRRPRRPQAQAVGHGPAQGPRLGRRQDPRGVRRLRVDPRDPREGPHGRPQGGPARHLPQAAPGRAPHRGGRADAARQPLLQPEALRPRQGRPLQGEQEAGCRQAGRVERPHPRRHRRDDPFHREAARRRDRDVGDVGPHVARRGRRHRPLRQPSPAHRG